MNNWFLTFDLLSQALTWPFEAVSAALTGVTAAAPEAGSAAANATPSAPAAVLPLPPVTFTLAPTTWWQHALVLTGGLSLGVAVCWDLADIFKLYPITNPYLAAVIHLVAALTWLEAGLVIDAYLNLEPFPVWVKLWMEAFTAAGDTLTQAEAATHLTLAQNLMSAVLKSVTVVPAELSAHYMRLAQETLVYLCAVVYKLAVFLAEEKATGEWLLKFAGEVYAAKLPAAGDYAAMTGHTLLLKGASGPLDATETVSYMETVRFTEPLLKQYAAGRMSPASNLWTQTVLPDGVNMLVKHETMKVTYFTYQVLPTAKPIPQLVVEAKALGLV